MLREEFVVLNAYVRKYEVSKQDSKLPCHETEKKNFPFPQKRVRRKLDKRAEINENENKNKNIEFDETKSSFFDNINKINNFVARLETERKGTNYHVDSMYPSYNVKEGYLTSGVFFLKTRNSSLTMRKTANPNQGEILQNV